MGIRYRNKKNADHLISALQAKYEATQYWRGGLYYRVTLKQEHKARKLKISIIGQVKDALHKFQHPTPTRPQQSPHQWTSQNQGSTANQLVQLTDGYPALDPYKARNFQQVL